MLIYKTTRDKYDRELSERFQRLIDTFRGRQAMSEDYKHGLRSGSYTKETLDRSVVIDSLELRLAVDDFQNILKEVKKLT